MSAAAETSVHPLLFLSGQIGTPVIKLNIGKHFVRRFLVNQHTLGSKPLFLLCLGLLIRKLRSHIRHLGEIAVKILLISLFLQKILPPEFP